MFDFLKPKPVRVQYLWVHGLKKKARRFQEEKQKVKLAFDKGFKIL